MSNNQFHIQSSADVLLLTFDEQWPEESYKSRFGDSFIKKAKALKTEKWAVIDDISNWPIKTPKDMDDCCDLTDTLSGIGFKHCAVVGHKYAISEWMMKKVIPEEVTLSFFDSINQAKEWLNSLGYQTTFT